MYFQRSQTKENPFQPIILSFLILPWQALVEIWLTPPSEIFNSEVNPNLYPKCVQKVAKESSDFKLDTFFMFVALEYTFERILGTFNEALPIKIKTQGRAIFWRCCLFRIFLNSIWNSHLISHIKQVSLRTHICNEVYLYMYERAKLLTPTSTGILSLRMPFTSSTCFES